MYFDKIERRTPGFTRAYLQNLMNEAAILAARHELKEISKDEIADDLERNIADPKRKMLSQKRKRILLRIMVIAGLWSVIRGYSQSCQYVFQILVEVWNRCIQLKFPLRIGWSAGHTQSPLVVHDGEASFDSI